MLKFDASVFAVCILISIVDCSYYDDLLMNDLYKRLDNNYEDEGFNSYQKYPDYYPQMKADEDSKGFYPYEKSNTDDALENAEKKYEANDELSNIDENDMNFIDPDIRGDLEYIRHGPSKWGFQYISGGAGEGEQELTPEGKQPNVQEVKSDESLPFYCHPPNPCPKGFTAEDGCDEGVEDTAEGQKKYINNLMKTGQCTCDREHMFQCPSEEENNQETGSINAENQLADMMSMLSQKYPYNQESDKQYVVAKKSPESESYENLVDPSKISTGNHIRNHLEFKRVAKKGFI